jgi:hypothetical protein
VLQADEAEIWMPPSKQMPAMCEHTGQTQLLTMIFITACQ